MTIKQEYSVGDTVWVYGIGFKTRPTKGTVVKSFTIDYDGISDDVQYVIAIPTEIEYLLEVRTWHTISQDENGPVGSLRGLKNLRATNKVVARTGYAFDPNYVEEDADGPSPDEIHAALEQSVDNSIHKPLILKESKPRMRRRPTKRKAKE